MASVNLLRMKSTAPTAGFTGLSPVLFLLPSVLPTGPHCSHLFVSHVTFAGRVSAAHHTVSVGTWVLSSQPLTWEGMSYLYVRKLRINHVMFSSRSWAFNVMVVLVPFRLEV